MECHKTLIDFPLFFFFASHVVECVLHSLILFMTMVAFSLRMEARVFLTCLLGNNLNRWFRHQLHDAQALNWWDVLAGHNAYFAWSDSHTKIRERLWLSFCTSSNRVLNKSFDSTIYIMMLTKTRDVLSLALYLADTPFCTIYVMVQDGIDLITTALEDRMPLRPLTSWSTPCWSLFCET